MSRDRKATRWSLPAAVQKRVPALCLQESHAGAKFTELSRVTFLSLLEQPFH